MYIFQVETDLKELRTQLHVLLVEEKMALVCEGILCIILNPKVLLTRGQISCAKFVRVIALFKARLHESYRLS